MKLLWLDLETTGLDPQTCQILEVAACVADMERPFDTRDPYEAVLRPPVKPLDVHPVVLEIHHKNGLWADCDKSTTTLAEVEGRLIALTGETPASDRENQTTLAGSCVSFDLAFINRWMPRLAKYLHYRVYDVSSVILFARSMGMPRPPKVEAHRAMADVRESIENARRAAHFVATIGVTRSAARLRQVAPLHRGLDGERCVTLAAEMLRDVPDEEDAIRSIFAAAAPTPSAAGGSDG